MGNVFIPGVSGVSAFSITDNLVFYTPFETNSVNVITKEIPAYSGTFKIVDGKVGKAMSVQKGYMAYSPFPISSGVGFTVCMWALFTIAPVYSTLMCETTSSANSWVFRVMKNGTLSELAVYVNGGYQYSGIATPALNTWAHIGFTYSPNKTLVFYLNGVQAKTIPNVTWPTVTPTKIVLANLGTTLGTNDNYNFYGYLDEVRVYDKVQTPQNMAKICKYGT